jgi:hypothetical protein
MCMQCVAQASPMIAVSFGVLRRDSLGDRVRAGLALSHIPYVSARAARPAPERLSRRERDAQRMARRLRPEARPTPVS